MSFTSLVFFIFLPVIVLVHWLTPHRFRWIPLLIASYFFYAFYNIWLLSLILTATFVCYISAICTENANTSAGKKAFVAFAAIICLGLLFIFKYLDFTIEGICSLIELFGGETNFGGFDLILPVGISFYTFQTMSYTFDVYRGTMKAERHLGYFALFVVFFPQLVAGPIERPSDLIPQLRAERRPSAGDFADGARSLIFGYAQKVLIADFVGQFVNAAYADVYSSGGLALIIATVLFAVQIYGDFSGYSMIATGCAKMMGIQLSKNFNRPYLAASMRDFWRRWHISLTKWFTDYLYIPLGGNKKGKVRRFINVLIVFLVSGLWHGANLTFVVWGGLHGLSVAIEGLLPRRENGNSIITALRTARTFIIVCFIWIFFRASTLAEAGEVIRAIFTDWRVGTTLSSLGMKAEEILPAILCVALLPLLESLPRYDTNSLPLSKTYAQSNCLLVWATLIIAIAVCWCTVLGENGLSAFIYFSF